MSFSPVPVCGRQPELATIRPEPELRVEEASKPASCLCKGVELDRVRDDQT